METKKAAQETLRSLFEGKNPYLTKAPRNRLIYLNNVNGTCNLAAEKGVKKVVAKIIEKKDEENKVSFQVSLVCEHLGACLNAQKNDEVSDYTKYSGGSENPTCPLQKKTNISVSPKGISNWLEF